MYVASVSRLATTSSADCTQSGEAAKLNDGGSFPTASRKLAKLLVARIRAKMWMISSETHKVILPLPFPEGWISRRAQKGFCTEELGPSLFHLPPPHIVCCSAASFLQDVTLLQTAASISLFRREDAFLPGIKLLHPERQFSRYRSCAMANLSGSAGLLSVTVISLSRTAWRDNC